MKNIPKKLIVVGGGLAGLSVAEACAGIGFDVDVVERSKYPGGHAAELACMATDACAKCSACVIQELISKINTHPRIRLHLGAMPSKLQGKCNDFTLSLQPTPGNEIAPYPDSERLLHEPTQIEGDYLVVATGFSPYDACHDPLLGLGKLKGVVTTHDLDQLLRKDSLNVLLPDRKDPYDLAFIQCVGSRDREAERGFCSQFCCRTTIRLANRLLYLKPDTRVAVFYIDLQIMSKEFQSFFRQAAKRIHFIQGVPAEVFPGEQKPLRLLGSAASSSTPKIYEIDRVVLAIGMSPSQSQKGLASILGLKLNAYGFFASPKQALGLESYVPGIFLAGGCAGPADIPATRRQALAVANRLAQLQKPTQNCVRTKPSHRSAPTAAAD